MRLPLEIAGKTDKGLKRTKNEDTFIVDPDLGLMVLADGMGGHSAGDVASQLASTVCSNQLRLSLQTGHVPIFKHVPQRSELDPRSLLLGDCVKFSNQAVFEAAQSNKATRNMGTTLVAALWLDGKLAVAHVGDSRLYMVRGGDITQCTTDHSFVQEQVDKGLIKPEEAEKSNMRNMLTRSIGISDDVEVDVNEIDLDEGDYVLLCSDGLTKMLDDEKILQTFQEKEKPDAIADDLVGLANKAGGDDNVTVIVAKIQGPKSSWVTLSDRLKKLFKKGN
ncbi:hypothetical protein BVX98_00160 [bacterium F11]|nr:hypothetical protein BVX98_00160 [bacterium F11]